MMTVGMPKQYTSPEEIIQAFIDATDWNAFWEKVTEDSAAEIEAYHQASARSVGAYV